MFRNFSENNPLKILLFSTLYYVIRYQCRKKNGTFNISGDGFFIVPLRINGDEEWGQIRQRWNSICNQKH